MILDFKPFFIHFNRSRRKYDVQAVKQQPRGFTSYISPSGNNRTVNFQIIHCSYKDNFCKSEGRSFALKQPVLEVNARDIPGYLHDAREYCSPESWRQERDLGGYNWVLKYMV